MAPIHQLQLYYVIEATNIIPANPETLEMGTNEENLLK